MDMVIEKMLRCLVKLDRKRSAREPPRPRGRPLGVYVGGSWTSAGISNRPRWKIERRGRRCAGAARRRGVRSVVGAAMKIFPALTPLPGLGVSKA